jgi:hypothetical protein
MSLSERYLLALNADIGSPVIEVRYAPNSRHSVRGELCAITDGKQKRPPWGQGGLQAGQGRGTGGWGWSPCPLS